MAVVAIDTEFERRYTYRPILSIVQLKKEGEEPVVYDVYKKKNERLVDLLEVLSDENVVKVIHSARQDVEAIFYRFRIEIQNVFDTQIAYKLIKNEHDVGYAKMVEDYCDKKIVKQKSLQNSNWLKRPLTDEQISYAKQDVAFLHEVYHKMMDFFSKNERKYKQFQAECSILEDEKNYSFNPQNAWRKIEHKFIHNINRNLIKEMFILREKLAYKVNIPREFAIKTGNLLDFIYTGDISSLKTHYKINKRMFIELYKKHKFFFLTLMSFTFG